MTLLPRNYFKICVILAMRWMGAVFCPTAGAGIVLPAPWTDGSEPLPEGPARPPLSDENDVPFCIMPVEKR